MTTDTPARAALAEAGYRCHQTSILYPGATIYQRRTDGASLTVLEYPRAYEMEAYAHDDRDAMLLRFYAYTPEQLAERLPELERRALAMMRAGREG